MKLILMIIAVFSLLMTGCTSAQNSAPDSGPGSPSVDEAAAEQNPVSPEDNMLQNLITRAIEDLAVRLGIDTHSITATEARPVDWPDASLGCPRPDMMYAQVITPGYLIRLTAGGRIYEYHADSGSQLISCEDPQAPAAGTGRDSM